MSRYSGKRYQGARRDFMKKKREEAQQRQAAERHRDEQRRIQAEYNEYMALYPLSAIFPRAQGISSHVLEVLQGKRPVPENRVGSPYGWSDPDTGDILFPDGARLVEGVDF